MSNYTEEIGNKLNNLLERTYDAEKGYNTAAENTEHSGLKQYFKNRAQQRYDFGHALKSEIRSFNEDVDKGGSTKGALHRTWMNTKALFSSDNAESMLEEAIRGEKAAVEEYNDVLNATNLPSSTANLLKNQRQEIESGLNSIKRLEDLK